MAYGQKCKCSIQGSLSVIAYVPDVERVVEGSLFVANTVIKQRWAQVLRFSKVAPMFNGKLTIFQTRVVKSNELCNMQIMTIYHQLWENRDLYFKQREKIGFSVKPELCSSVSYWDYFDHFCTFHISSGPAKKSNTNWYQTWWFITL